MTGKRKRNRPGQGTTSHEKRQKLSGDFQTHANDPVVKHALLAQHYPEVLSLRQYLLSKLPSASKIRRKKIVTIGRHTGPETSDRDKALAHVLDQTLVGVSKYGGASQEDRWQQWTSFSQKADTSISAFNISGIGLFSQSEIVDFSIWLLFSKAGNGRPQHLLCQGFRKEVSARSVRRDGPVISAIPGLISTYPNSHVTSMTASPWPQVLGLMGKEGEKAMIDLILDCGIFLPFENGRGNYHQLSGQPLSELKPLLEVNRVSEAQVVQPEGKPVSGVNPELSVPNHTPASIVFVRNRMLYARAALNAQGGVRFGLRHIHVLNRYSEYTKDSHDQPSSNSTSKPHPSTVRIMMYVFPRQFSLHNVFTHDVDHRQTSQALKDYTLREDEINLKYPSDSTVKIPKRLRGKGVALVRKLQIQHNRCPYKKLLEHYCPVFDETEKRGLPSSQLETPPSTSTISNTEVSTDTSSAITLSDPVPTPPRNPSLMDRATPTAQVSAFCRAVLSNLIPREFWGIGETQVHNETLFYRNVDRFIFLRRFESLSLHEVSQGIKLTGIEWLRPPVSSSLKLSQSDVNKRLEIIHELIYYLFDSILIPLIRTNFYVTESNVHGYRLFYFRQDVWRALTEPEIASLKLNMFQEVKLEHARTILDSRSLGFSQVRLLPKATGVRPIMNLKRRTIKKGHLGILGSSINSILSPVYNVLMLEQASHPDRLGATLFSVGDLYTKLKAFKSVIQNSAKPLYFVKVDVKAAFDTIPQDAVLRCISSIPSESEYRIAKHVEIRPGIGYYAGDEKSKPMRKWTALAKAPDDFQSFDEGIESKLAADRKNTVFVENITNQFRKRDDLLDLLAEHIQRNMVKIGKKYYRQREGIPQGSVLSSLMCNFFYADLEMQHLQFLHAEDSLLLRLIDDFLLITSNPAHAKQFLQIMHDGLPAYGVQVNPDKTLVNFKATIKGKKVTRLDGSGQFPYCGSFIDTKTLNISKDRDRKKNMAITDALTVEYSKMPGKTFHRKVLNMFKIQSHAMFFDTSHNSLSTVKLNIYTAFVETATKMWSYARCLPTKKRPSMRLVIKAIQSVSDLAFLLLRGKARKTNNKGFICAVSKTQVDWLAMSAFRYVLVRKQSKYETVIAWLDTRSRWIEVKDPKMTEQMRRLTGGDRV